MEEFVIKVLHVIGICIKLSLEQCFESKYYWNFFFGHFGHFYGKSMVSPKIPTSRLCCVSSSHQFCTELANLMHDRLLSFWLFSEHLVNCQYVMVTWKINVVCVIAWLCIYVCVLLREKHGESEKIWGVYSDPHQST